ncbi:MAG: 16S rRNA (guanine(527)-N(7))-methyltransferase RsmG [Bacteroides sp. SM23_62_1]|nr:MAG: 16S rRNA (guanine(527)-N(7))-methyltransferase RsmG [Bacteroides sp. SM23_62_1]
MKLIRKYFPELTPSQVFRFEELGNLYISWNNKINVISRKDIAHLYERHVLHSLAIAKFNSFSPGTTILDVGTGGGLPGIPLAIYFPECSFTLIDSVRKKIMVTHSICETLKLKNTRTIKIRAEQFNDQFNFIVARGVTDLAEFMRWVVKNISSKSGNGLENGIIYLKGGDLATELTGIKPVHVTEISRYFEEDYFRTKKIIYVPSGQSQNP